MRPLARLRLIPILIALIPCTSAAREGPAHPPGEDLAKSTLQSTAFATLLQLAALGPEAIGDAQASDEFGVSVAVSGNTVVIGAERDDNGADPNAGAVYVFVRDGNGWVQQAKLAAPAGVTLEEFFGSDVDIEGDTLVVGAFRDTGAGNLGDRGAAYVFKRTAGVWGAPQKLVADDATGVFFGYSVAISGNTIAVGAYGDNNARGSGAGAVYMFDLQAGSYVFDEKLLASDGAAGDEFGIAVGLDGDRLVVGADQGDTTAAANSGSAYLFMRTLGTWIQTPELQPAGLAAGERAGLAVAIDGGTVLVGALDHNLGGTLPSAGAVFVYDCSTPVCAFQTRLSGGGTSASLAGDRFGVGVAVHGNRAVIGADFGENANPGAGTSGVAYLFTRTGSNWDSGVRFTQAAPTNNNERFGYAAALDENLVAVGAFNASDPVAAVPTSGATFLFAIDGIFSDGFEN